MVKPLIGLCVLWLWPMTVWAEMPDPTRPPTQWLEGGGEAPVIRPVVSSVMLHESRAYAIVAGQVVRVGDRVGDAKVVRITERGVWLKGPAGVELLELLPGVSKAPSKKSRQEQK